MTKRQFLFLQGPHGPFFSELAGLLRTAGHGIHRIGFNAGDRHFWAHGADYTPFTGQPDDWPAFLKRVLDGRGVTDIVLYADTRARHAVARAEAARRGIPVHCFEEGYLRPFWVTYERGGVNGNSRLMGMSVPQMRAMLSDREVELTEAPPLWGALRQHMALGAIYHWHVLFRNRAYSGYRTHRSVPVAREWWLHVRRLALMPWHAAERRRETRRLFRSGMNYHLVLLQLAHDASFRDHSDFRDIGEFIDLTCAGFARGAPRLHRLVFKTHPLEDGREPLDRLVAAAAARHGIPDRVQVIRGGKLGALLDDAVSVVTVNSTAGQQALWRGLPLKAFGRSVYAKPEFVSLQPVDEFFANPRPPDADAYRVYRQFLLATSQVPGSFYTADGRARILRAGIDAILADRDPYDGLSLLPQIRNIPPLARVS